MTKVEIYNEAVKVAQESLGNDNPLSFEILVPQRALELSLNPAEFALFKQSAIGIRGALIQLKTQDAQIAAQVANAKAKADAQAKTVSDNQNAPTGNP